MEAITAYRKPPLRYAGGFRVTEGGYDFRLVRRRPMQKWRKAVKQVLVNARKRDPAIEKMILDCAAEWSTYSCREYQSWPSLTPLEKQQALFAWILKQKKRSAVDIIASGVAGLLYFELNPQKRHDDYARAVSIARPVWFLLRKEWRTYQHESGHGSITVQRVWINERVKIRSRNAAQKIEAAIRKHAGWFMEEYHDRLVHELRKKMP